MTTPSPKKPAAKKPAAKKSAARPATKKTTTTSTAKKPAAKKPAAKKPAAKAKAAAKPAGKKATSAARKPAARATSAAKAATKPATRAAKTVVRGAVKRTTAAKPKAKAKPGTTSTRISAAGKSLGEQVFRQVEELIATGKTAKAAFDVVAAERKMTVANVQQHYYRFKRKAQTQARSTAKRANSRARTTVARTQQKALETVVSASAKLPTKQAQKAARQLREQDFAALGNDLAKAFAEFLEEARKNERFRRLEKSVVALLQR